MAILAAGSPIRAAEVSGDDPLARSARQAIAGALTTALEHARSDHPVAWGDPAASLSGSITVFSPMLRGGRWCRGFRYVARNALNEITDTGQYCRDPAGLWRMTGTAELLDKRAIGMASPSMASPNMASPNQPDATLLRLQKNLVRLAYGGPSDGSRDAAFTNALMQFEADEGLRHGTDPDTIRRALSLSTATLARSNADGACPAADGGDGPALVCGRRR